MAKAPGRRLKVFQAQFGFHDSVVAAPSRAAALRAWGTRQNLFSEGQAVETSDPQAIADAKAHPEVPLRRPVGSKGPFELEPTALPAVPPRPKSTSHKPRVPKPSKPPPPPADRSALDAAEAALKAVDDRRKREEATLREAQDELDRRVAARQADYVERRKAASAAVVAARQAYREAGGRD